MYVFFWFFVIKVDANMGVVRDMQIFCLIAAVVFKRHDIIKRCLDVSARHRIGHEHVTGHSWRPSSASA